MRAGGGIGIGWGWGESVGDLYSVREGREREREARLSGSVGLGQLWTAQAGPVGGEAHRFCSFLVIFFKKNARIK